MRKLKTMSSIFLLFIGSVLCAKATNPNIVFILADDLGWTDLACYGSDLYETPNLDKLAQEGVRFTDAYASAPLCSATRAAILTGWTPARQHLHGTTPHKRPAATSRQFSDYETWNVPARMFAVPSRKMEIPVQLAQLPLSRVTIAELLKEQGYATGFFGKWHLGPDADKYPEYQGFDVNMGGSNFGWPPSYFSPYNIYALPNGPNGEYLTERLADEACAFMEQKVAEEQPFYLHMAFFNAHGPWQGKPDYVEYFKGKIRPGMTHTNPVYAAMIKGLDDGVGRIMRQLDELGIADETILIFTSDNGGVNLRHPERAGNKDGFVSSNAPLRGFKATTWEGGIRVPQIIRWPGITEAGNVISEPVVSHDFFPTLLAAAGAVCPADHPIDGIDLKPILQGQPSSRTRLTWFMPHHLAQGTADEMPSSAVIREGDWKLINLFGGEAMLYNLAKDVGETSDLAASMPEKVSELKQTLMTELKAQNAFIPGINLRWDKDAFLSSRRSMFKKTYGQKKEPLPMQPWLEEYLGDMK